MVSTCTDARHRFDLKAVLIVLMALLAIELGLISLLLYMNSDPTVEDTPVLMIADKGTDGLFTVDGQKYVIVRGEIT